MGGGSAAAPTPQGPARTAKSPPGLWPAWPCVILRAPREGPGSASDCVLVVAVRAQVGKELPDTEH